MLKKIIKLFLRRNSDSSEGITRFCHVHRQFHTEEVVFLNTICTKF